jgi:hypothetical protein
VIELCVIGYLVGCSSDQQAPRLNPVCTVFSGFIFSSFSINKLNSVTMFTKDQPLPWALLSFIRAKDNADVKFKERYE